MRIFFSLGLADQKKKVIVWANVIHFSDLKIGASKAQPVLFTFQLVQFLPLQHTFVFLFPFLPITLNFTQVRAFHLSLFLLHCAMNCLFTFSDSFRISCLSVVHSLSLSLLLSDSFVAVHAVLLTEAATNCHHGLANQEFRMPGPGTIESNHASINITQNFLSLSSLLTPLALVHIISTSGSRGKISPVNKHWHQTTPTFWNILTIHQRYCFYAPRDRTCSHHHLPHLWLVLFSFVLNF